MPPETRGRLIVSDLDEIVGVLADTSLSSESQVDAIVTLSRMRKVSFIGAKDTRDLWTRTLAAALDSEPECLPLLFKNIREQLGYQSWTAVDVALHKLRTSSIYRLIREVHPEVGDEAQALLIVSDKREMIQAAKRLRETAIDVRRILLRPLLSDIFLSLERELEVSFPDPEWLRMEIIDKAVDVVTAADYLLALLATAPRSERLALAEEIDSQLAQVRSDEERADWLNRRQLHARADAVREGTRLLALLRRDIAFG